MLGCLLFAHNANARFVVEQGGLKVRSHTHISHSASGSYTDSNQPLILQISFPPEAKSKYPGGFDMALANFGAPIYGGALM